MSNAPSRIQHPYQGMALEEADRALSDADRDWTPHPINIRVSIPLFFGRWFFTLVGGPERRDPKRRAIERRKHPLLTLGNVFFLFVVGSVIGVAVAALMINGAVQLLDGSYSVITP